MCLNTKHIAQTFSTLAKLNYVGIPIIEPVATLSNIFVGFLRDPQTERYYVMIRQTDKPLFYLLPTIQNKKALFPSRRQS